MTSLSLSKCLFCYKRTSQSSDLGGKERISKFLRGFQRHKQTNLPIVGDRLSLEGSPVDGVKVKLCSSCSEVVDSFNGFYAELELLQLKLNLVLGTVADTIKLTNRDPDTRILTRFLSDIQTSLRESNNRTPPASILRQITTFRQKIERTCHPISTQNPYPQSSKRPQIQDFTEILKTETPNLEMITLPCPQQPETHSLDLELDHAEAESEEIELKLETVIDPLTALADPLEDGNESLNLLSEGPEVNVKSSVVTRSYPCKKCGRPYSSGSSRHRHEISCGGIKRFKCVCENEYSQMSCLKKHQEKCDTGIYSSAQRSTTIKLWWGELS